MPAEGLPCPFVWRALYVATCFNALTIWFFWPQSSFLISSSFTLLILDSDCQRCRPPIVANVTSGLSDQFIQVHVFLTLSLKGERQLQHSPYDWFGEIAKTSGSRIMQFFLIARENYSIC